MRRRLFLGTLFTFAVLNPAPASRAQETDYTNRWEKEIRSFEAQDKLSPPQPGAVVFTGSSSIRGWESLAEDFSPLPVLNRGFGGSQVADAFRFADRIVIPYRPVRVLLYAGDNDIAEGKSPEDVVRDFGLFVGKIHGALPGVPICFISIKPSLKRWSFWEAMKKANRLVKEYCDKNETLEFIDVGTPMLGANGLPRAELFLEDGLHLNSQGYRLWTSIIKPRLLQPAPREKK